MIDPFDIAQSIIFREAMTLRLAPESYVAEARASLKERLIKELQQAARHACADLLEVAKEAEEFLSGEVFFAHIEEQEAEPIREKLRRAIAKAEALSE